MNLKIYFFIVANLISFQIFAQDIILNNPALSPLHLNPSFSGNLKNARLSVAAQLKWKKNTNGGYRTINLAYDQPINPLRSGVGVRVQRTSIPYYSGAVENSAYIAWVYPVRIPSLEVEIRPSVEFGGILNKRYYFQESYTTGNIDISSGLIIKHKKFSIGGALFHINQPKFKIWNNPNQTFSIIRSFQSFARYEIDIDKIFKITPFILFAKQGVHEVIQSTITCKLNDMYVGSGIVFNEKYWLTDFRFFNENSFTFLFGYSNRMINVGYTLNYLRYLGLTHEIGLQLFFIKNINKN